MRLAKNKSSINPKEVIFKRFNIEVYINRFSISFLIILKFLLNLFTVSVN